MIVRNSFVEPDDTGNIVYSVNGDCEYFSRRISILVPDSFSAGGKFQP